MKKDISWTAKLSALLFSLFALLSFTLTDGHYYLSGGIMTVLHRWFTTDSVLGFLVSKLVFIPATAVILGLVIMLFIKKRNILTFVFTALLALMSTINSLVILLPDIRFYLYCVKEVFTFGGAYEAQYLISLIPVLTYPALLMILAAVILLNSTKAMRAVSAWTRFVGFVPGALWAVISVVYRLVSTFHSFYALYSPMTPLGLLNDMIFIAVNLILSLALIFMGIWITSGNRKAPLDISQNN